MKLIDADELKKDFNLNFGGVCHAAAAAEIIDRQPIIDPESLQPKAHWIYDGKIDEDGNLVCRCSRCEHGDRHSPGITVPYCWFCGAKMED